MMNKLTKDERSSIVKRGQQDPVWWLRKVLGVDPWEKQAEIALAVRDYPRTFVASANGVGKSWIAARIALWWLCCFRNSIVATTAPTFRQVVRVLWPEIRKAYKRSRFPLGGRLLNTSLELDDQWYAFGFSTDDPERFQGLHAEHMLVIADEAAGISGKIYEAIDAVISSSKARFLAIGNPLDPRGCFYDGFREGPLTAKIHISAYDIPNVVQQRTVIQGMTSYEWVKDKLKRWGEKHPSYVSRVLGRFPSDAENTVIPLSWVEAAVERWRILEDQNEPLADLSAVSLDVADGGDDKSIQGKRYGQRIILEDVTRQDKYETMVLAGNIISLVGGKKGIRSFIDSIGVGAGVVSRCREEGIDVIPINAAEGTKRTDSSGQMHFANVRAAMWWGFRELLDPENGADFAIAPNDDLIGDLTAPTWKRASGGKILIESKEDIHKRLGRSTDWGDACVMLTWIVDKSTIPDKIEYKPTPTAESDKDLILAGVMPMPALKSKSNAYINRKWKTIHDRTG